MKRQKFVDTAHVGDNTKFVYIPEMAQKANFVYKELSEIARPPEKIINKGDLTMIMKLADEVKVALVTAACVLGIAIIFKNVRHVQVDFIISNSPSIYL